MENQDIGQALNYTSLEAGILGGGWLTWSPKVLTPEILGTVERQGRLPSLLGSVQRNLVRMSPTVSPKRAVAGKLPVGVGQGVENMAATSGPAKEPTSKGQKPSSNLHVILLQASSHLTWNPAPSRNIPILILGYLIEQKASQSLAETIFLSLNEKKRKLFTLPNSKSYPC
ncbi:hypothetical protein BDN72DRAFT_945468 [Pluteus cervinus]|uniref:Uncharacterized protein n=1 Tax=Pluteus cervinus TaxID=181527 RepID=A0ACD3A1F2_9AGAR|nr:hypothetical protein BDN72DRAFT_945468 [Pluteus cervinus]